MKPTSALLVLSLAASGCLANPGPATFREPAAAMAGALARVAEQPASRTPVPAEALRDLRIIGNRALLDYRSESGAPKSLSSLSICAPLELRDPVSNQRIWSVDRPRGCDDEILATSPRLTLLGMREEAGKAALTLSVSALDTGALVAAIPLEKGAIAVPSGDAFVVVQGAAGAQRVSLHDGQRLEAKWQVTLDDAGAVTKVVTVAGSVLVFGAQATAIDRESGKKLGSTSLGGSAFALDVVTTTDAAYAMIVRDKAETAVARVGPDGTLAWVSSTKGILDVVSATAAFVVDRSVVTALRASDGTTSWTGKLPGPATGGGLVVKQGKETLFVVPHEGGVTAFDITSGAVRFSVSPFGPGDGVAHATDRLSSAGAGLLILDTARGIAGLDLATEGRPRYALRVRSLPHVHRRNRMLTAYGAYDVKALLDSAHASINAARSQQAAVVGLSSSVGGGMTMGTAQMSMAVGSYLLAAGAAGFAALAESTNARRAQQASVALRQARLDEESPFLLRPVSWPTGRGLLVVRKSDGAFHEIVTGPPDVYEDAFRPTSVAALVPGAKRLLTFSEGVDTSKWEEGVERAPVKLVPRSLLSYAIEEASFHPASEYERRSLVPSFGVETPAVRAADTASPPSPPAPPPVASTPPVKPPPPAPPVAPVSTSKPAPAPTSCRTHLDCKGGQVCPRGQCVAPSCVGDRDCGAGQFCSLEGVCERPKPR